jgi:hypothetical protein
MKIKSTVLHILAAGCGCLGLLYGMGLEGNAQVGAPITDGQFITAMVLILAAMALMRLGFAAEDRERAAKRRKYGKINRTHARNPEYPENQERGA